MPMKVHNKENLPKEGRVVICCNHTSMKDPILISLAHNRMVRYMAKAELFQNKFVSFIISNLGAFPVQRGHGDTGALDVAKSILEKEGVLGIFIEGTRSKDRKLGQPKPGAVMLAYESHAPILPMCITAKNASRPRLFHRVIVSCGDLILPEDLGIETGAHVEFRRASRLVMSKIQELRDRDLKAF